MANSDWIEIEDESLSRLRRWMDQNRIETYGQAVDALISFFDSIQLNVMRVEKETLEREPPLDKIKRELREHGFDQELPGFSKDPKQGKLDGGVE